MENLALIYVGGNTTRFALWQINDDRSYRLLESYKETLKLGRDTMEEYLIPEPKIDRLVNIIRNFREFAESLNADKIFVILSEFFARIDNKEQIRLRLQAEAGVEAIELTSEEELSLDYLAIINAMRIRNSLIVDIAGGSTQLAWVKDGQLMESYLLPMGTLTLTAKFHLEEIVSQEAHLALDALLSSEIDKIPWLHNRLFEDLIFVGGSARAISKIDRKKRRYPISIIHEYPMQDLDIKAMYTNFMTKSLKQRYTIEGLDKDRADILPGALAIVYALLKKTGIQQIRISGAGIREGFLFSYLTRTYGEMPDMLDRSIDNILSRHNVDKEKAERRYQLTKAIYEGLKGVHRPWENLDEILKVSAKLRDVGLSVRFYNHNRHNFYIVSNSELNGLDHREVIMAALTASFDQGFSKETPLLAFGQIINRMDLAMVYDLGICVSIAENLLKSDKKTVVFDHAEVTPECVKLVFKSDDPLRFELHEVMKHNETFCYLYSRPLDVEILPLQGN